MTNSAEYRGTDINKNEKPGSGLILEGVKEAVRIGTSPVRAAVEALTSIRNGVASKEEE